MSSKTNNITVNLSEYDFKTINELVEEGLFLNSEDFIREAIKEKLNTYSDEIVLRDVSYIQMKEEIIEYVKKHPGADAADIEEDLLLDAFKVNDIICELIKNGLFVEV